MSVRGRINFGVRRCERGHTPAWWAPRGVRHHVASPRERHTEDGERPERRTVDRGRRAGRTGLAAGPAERARPDQRRPHATAHRPLTTDPEIGETPASMSCRGFGVFRTEVLPTPQFYPSRDGRHKPSGG